MDFAMCPFSLAYNISSLNLTDQLAIDNEGSHSCDHLSCICLPPHTYTNTMMAYSKAIGTVCHPGKSAIGFRQILENVDDVALVQ